MRFKFWCLLLSSVLWRLPVVQAQECGLLGINESYGLRHKRDDNGKWGVLDERNVLIIPFTYEFTNPMTPDLIKVTMSPGAVKMWGAIDRQGKQVLPMEYDELEAAGCQHLQGRKDGITYLFNAQGRVLYKEAGTLRFEMYPGLHRLVVSKLHLDPVHPSAIISAVLDTRTFSPAVPASTLVGEAGANQLFATVVPNLKQQPVRKLLPFFMVPYRNQSSNGVQPLHRITDVQGHTLVDSVIGYSYATTQSVVFINRSLGSPEIVTDTLLRPIKWLSGKYAFVQPTGPGNRWWLVGSREKFGVLDGTGKVVVPIKYKGEGFDYVGNNWFRLHTRNRGDTDFTFISTANRVVDLPGYYLEGSSSELGAHPFVVKNRTTYKAGIFDLREGFIVPARYDALVPTADGVVFFQGDSAGYMDRRGRITLLTSNCQSLSTFTNGYAVCGKLVPNASRDQFPSAQIIYTTHAYPVAVQYAYMDATGKLLTGYFDWVGPFKDGYAMVIKNNETFMINAKGHKVQAANGGLLVSYFAAGVAVAKLNGTYTLVNKAGKPVLPGPYNAITTERISQPNSTIFTKDHRGNHMLALEVPKLEDGAVEVVTMNNQKQRVKLAGANQ
ncbi:WG repeat-containing protein [Hymenobacter properus]|uniref:WG repeat-containing protein n=1 Tax=Hymenobacter properus TaxID=2791026 RepID=A0A931BQI1_9BACT|nr:WG repeat-containing protein [Hymenobacter properus]MBF9143740.1 WG repeat-containing protein [Hymenobacter properus]MBR7722553.1 WG repeat-containing protein [Microvirga sp. SRT04]